MPLQSSLPFVGEIGITLANTTKNGIQTVTSDKEKREADLDWVRLMESLSEETAPELRPEKKKQVIIK